MAKRVSPRNMNREMAWLCPRVLEWGSRVSGSLAAMFKTFFWAAASGTCTSPTTVSADSTTRHVASHAKRDIEFSPLAERSLGKRDRVPQVVTSTVEDHAEHDSNIATSVESAWDESTGQVRCGHRPVRPRDWAIRYTNRDAVTTWRPAGAACSLRPSDPAHELRAAVERGQHLVGLRRIQIEDETRHAGVAIALDQIEVLGDAEDRDRQ